MGRRSGRPAGDGRKTDASFALAEELLARYEGAKVTADKLRAYVWKSYMSVSHEFMRGPPDSLIVSLEFVRIIYRPFSMDHFGIHIYIFRNFITIIVIMQLR